MTQLIVCTCMALAGAVLPAVAQDTIAVAEYGQE